MLNIWIFIIRLFNICSNINHTKSHPPFGHYSPAICIFIAYCWYTRISSPIWYVFLMNVLDFDCRMLNVDICWVWSTFFLISLLFVIVIFVCLKWAYGVLFVCSSFLHFIIFIVFKAKYWSYNIYHLDMVCVCIYCRSAYRHQNRGTDTT